MNYRLTVSTLLLAVILLPVNAQKKSTKINDSNTPLHFLQPSYPVPYGKLTVAGVKADIDRVFNYIDAETPARVVNRKTGKEITDYTLIDADAQLERGSFRLASYEWGVTYSALLDAADVTGDSRYSKYVINRFRFLAKVAPQFKREYYETGIVDPQMKQIITPQALDDAGAVCAAMMKAQIADHSLPLKELIDNYFNFIMYHQYRLSDGTFARNRPQLNTLWTDDMFMGIPAVAWMGRYASDYNSKYQADAVRQYLQFSERMFIPETGLFRHGWVEGSSEHPAFCWARANGWALLSACELLDALPTDYPERSKILELFKKHLRGIAAYQSSNGLWHQLLDRNDTYLETSASAIYVYCIAHAINKGWVDAVAYGPVAQLGWQAVAQNINDKGQVEGTCVGTGMAFDPAYYSYRPVSVYAAHGYGPVIWAGAEMIRLLTNTYPKMNDSAVQYYTLPQKTSAPIFEAENGRRPKDVVPGSTRKSKNFPLVFLIGDSTVKCGDESGSDGRWGWGTFFNSYFDTIRIGIENHALGGRSSRTYYTERLWDKVLPAIQKGDYLLIDFGHNDGGPFNTGRARASLEGDGENSKTFIMERNGGPENVYSFGHYLRIFIRQAKAKGATVIVLSHTPGNTWVGDKMVRCSDTYAKWDKEVANKEGAFFIDLNNLTALKFEAMGEKKTATYYVDRVHNTKAGALLNGQSVADGIRDLQGCDLKKYLKQ